MNIQLDQAKVKKLAELQGKSFNSLARCADMDGVYLRRIVGTEPRPRMRRRLCESWGCSFDEIFTVISEPADHAEHGAVAV